MKYIMSIICGLAILLSIQSTQAQCINDGVPVDGVPNWNERSIYTFINAERMHPRECMEFYIPGVLETYTNVLQTNIYPAVEPIKYTQSIGARVHSIDLANTPNCPPDHNGCDGSPWTDRYNTYFPNWNLAGESLGLGYTAPISAVLGLILDQTNGVPAGDNSGDDGHRYQMMFKDFTEVSIGYAYGPNFYHRYYTIDYIRPLEVTQQCGPIFGGTHWFVENNIDFVINFKDANSFVPMSTNIIIGTETHPLNLLFGTDGNGTYGYNITNDNMCHSYHFEITDFDGIHWRYPGHGEFQIYNNDTCTDDWIDCKVDFNHNGILEVNDIFDFFNIWFAGDLSADFNNSGILEVQDIFDFLNAWFAGCPLS